MPSNNADAFSQNSAFPGGLGLSSSWLNGFFGDGTDGDVTIAAGTTTLTRDMNYNNLTVQSGGILKPAGWRIFVKGTLTINAGGTINDNGNDASGSIAGGILTSPRGSLGAGGGAGGAGRNTTGAGSAGGGSGGNSSLNSNNLFPAGGTGGTAGGANTGGVAGTGAAPSPTQKWNNVNALLTGRTYSGGAWNGGGGGSGGGCDITGGAATSGGGGSGAGIVYICANAIANSGTISANGGKGADGVTTTGVAGGGGGGGGGLIALITGTNDKALIGSVTANGGVAGASVGTGSGAPSAAQPGCIGIMVLS